MLEEDPGCATLFWDETQETVGIKFPIDGKVMKELKRKKLQTYFEEDEL